MTNREYVCLAVPHLEAVAGETHTDYLPQEEVVRCWNCAKWHRSDKDNGVIYGTCDEFSRPDRGCCTRANGFCAWGKRKKR